jgi:hypothetical protein
VSKRWQPGDIALITATQTPCEIDVVYSGACALSVWIPNRRNAMGYKILNPIELEELP